jgi:protocatechuate 3,4-dioxygenase, alpha subunit
MSKAYTPTQTIGPFFHYGLQWALVAGGDRARIKTLTGKVLDAAGATVPDAMIEAWSPPDASSAGAASTPAWQRAYTDAQGSYALHMTPTSGRPALLVTLFARGMLRHAFSAVFTDSSDQTLLPQIPIERRGTLLAKCLIEGEGRWEWNIHLQGPSETVFLEYL